MTHKSSSGTEPRSEAKIYFEGTVGKAGHLCLTLRMWLQCQGLNCCLRGTKSILLKLLCPLDKANGGRLFYEL